MNKEKTIAATRIKNKIAKAAKNEAKARSLVKVSEAKVKKISEAFDAAKKVVDQHKQTLELAKKQILESRELNKRYEQLLNLKYNQLNSLTEANKKLADDKKEVDDTIDKCKKAIEIKRKQTESLKETVESLQQRIKTISERKSETRSKIIDRYKQLMESNERKYKSQIRVLEAKIEELKDELKEVRVKAKVVPFNDQAVKAHDSEKAKVESRRPVRRMTESSNASKIDRIAKIYSTKHKISEAFSKRVLSKLGLNEGVRRIENLIEKRNSRKSEAKAPISEKFTDSQVDKLVKIYSTKYRVPETASRKIFDKYNKNEAIMKLESIIKEISKYSSKKNEAKSAVKTNETKAKVNETKTKVNESAIAETDGTTLYSHFI